MKQFFRLSMILLALSCFLLLTGCTPIDRSAWSSPGYYDVYDSYRYPHRGYGYGGYPGRYHRPNQPVPKPRSSAGMGRPSGM